METKDLEIFQSVALNKSVSKSALELNYTQSNITNRIHKLEKDLNTVLFLRNNRGVILTPEGEVFLKYTEKILNLFREVSEVLKNPKEFSGTISIGATDITTAVRLPTILSIYHGQYPKVNLSLKTISTADLINDILKYHLDLAFITNKVNHPKIVEESLVDEELVFIMHKSQPPIKTFSDIKNKTLLVFRSGCTYRSKVEELLNDEEIHPIKKMEFGTIDGMLGCVKAGVGIALVSKTIANQYKDDQNIIVYPLTGKYQKVSTIMIRRNDVPVSNALSKFIEIATKIFSQDTNDFTY